MSQINLRAMVDEWKNRYGESEIQGRPRLSNLELQLSTISWNGGKVRHTPGATRHFEMNNKSPANGQGHLQTVKEGRPITTVHVTTGVIEGFPKLTLLDMPSEVHSTVGQTANIKMFAATTQRLETSMLQVDAAVKLGSRQLKVATVENTDLEYNGVFTGSATLSGLVLFDNSEIPVVQIFQDLKYMAPEAKVNFWGTSVSWKIAGKLQVNFADNQKLVLNR